LLKSTVRLLLSAGRPLVPPAARLLVPAALLMLPPTLPAQEWPPPEEAYFDWTDLQFTPEEYAARRHQLLERIRARGGGVMLVPSGSGVTHGATFRQADGFNYLTGLELPGSVLVLDADGNRVSLFLPARDPRFENPDRRNDFPGRPLGDDPVMRERSGLADLRPVGELEPLLDRWSGDGTTVWIDAGGPGEVEAPSPGLAGELGASATALLALSGRQPPLVLANAFETMARIRMVKSPAEIAALSRAANATVGAIRHAASAVRPGVDERTLEGEFEAACKRTGSQRPAFSSIVKSGPNSLWPWRVLAAQYDRRNRSMDAGDLVIFDVGCEVDYYVSDVGRTFPVGGSFSPRQREVLEMITDVADSVIAGVRPGVTLVELKQLALRVIPEAERRHMQTGSFYGHHLGLSVGDPALVDVPLQAGMVFTVEPWYYNHEEEIAVFVEDMVLVTRDGARVLTEDLPRSPEALARMVGS
jgi:Xaa-Pro aminopeptidase